MGVRVVVQDWESIAQILRRFKKQIQLNGVMWELRKRDHFVDGTEVRRAKRFRKRFKAREAMLLAQMSGKLPVESVEKAKLQFWKRTGKP